MATTRLTDIVEVKIFANIVESKILENSKIRQSGIIVSDPRISQKARTEGFEGTLPFWKAIPGGEATTMTDDPEDKGVPGKVQQGSMTARMIQRGLGFQAMDIAAYASQGDAIEYAAGEFARLWVADEELAVLAMLDGVYADNVANDSGDMLKAAHLTTGTITAGNKMSGGLLIEGRKQLGDLGGELKFLFAHSDVVNNLRAAEGNAFVPASKTDIGLATYYDYAIIETDNLTKGGTTSFPIYTSYTAGSGLFGYAAGSFGDTALAQVRDEFSGNFSGQETVISRRRYILHPFGFSNQVAPTNGVSQTNAELKAAATWNRVVDRRAIPLVKFTTNG